MSFSFKPEKINTFYSLMAALVLVIGTILLCWMNKSETSNEKIIVGVCTIAFFVFFLIIVYKILTHENSSVNSLDNKTDAENIINNLTGKAKIAVIKSKLNELLKSSIENQDIISIQKIHFIQSSLDCNQLQSPSNSNKNIESKDNKSELDDVNELLSQIMKLTLK